MLRGGEADAPEGRRIMPEDVNILVVDDDPLLREIAVEMLRNAGYRCRTAEDGDVAVRRLHQAPADLVVLDVIMPNREGIETLREIRRLWPATRVIMISSGARVMPADSLLKTAMALGADAAVIKPLREAEFIPLVARLLAEPSAPRNTHSA